MLVDLCYPDVFVLDRDMVVQVVRLYFLMGLLGYLFPGCGRVLFGFSVPGLWA